ncbi:MAG: 30S ribosome-binding factor RbfA [Clostridia bacterium]|nr:30S ribosome-binding factor RbfA [Clostridia bacterium]
MAKVRMERLAEELKKTVSSIIFEMKDPRIPTVTSITSMEVTQDLKYAKARVSVYGENEEAAKEAVAALNHAAGFIQHEVGNRMTIRRVPQIKFVGDDSIAYSVHIAEVLRSLHKDEPQESEDPEE